MTWGSYTALATKTQKNTSCGAQVKIVCFQLLSFKMNDRIMPRGNNSINSNQCGSCATVLKVTEQKLIARRSECNLGNQCFVSLKELIVLQYSTKS